MPCFSVLVHDKNFWFKSLFVFVRGERWKIFIGGNTRMLAEVASKLGFGVNVLTCALRVFKVIRPLYLTLCAHHFRTRILLTGSFYESEAFRCLHNTSEAMTLYCYMK